MRLAVSAETRATGLNGFLITLLNEQARTEGGCSPPA